MQYVPFIHTLQPQAHNETMQITVMIVNMLQYTRSHNANAWSKPLTLYLKHKGASAKALDFLHALGITMSSSWVVRAYKRISASAMSDVCREIHLHPWRFGYDNLNIPFQAYSQRLDNKSHFDCGTTASVFIKPFAPKEPELDSMALQETRKQGRKNPLGMLDLVHLDQALTYEHRADPLFLPPASEHQLPHGPEHVTKEYVLGTVPINEATYEGTEELISEYMRQLGLTNDEEFKKTALYRVLACIGDQLTVERLRGLSNFRSEDRNGHERMDYALVLFGRFHLLMAWANSLHKQYFGTTSGRGLRHAFSLLGRKGLQSAQIKGPFYHHLHEGISHVTEARFRAAWMRVGKVKNLAELRRKSPEELASLTDTIFVQFASNDGLDDMDLLGREDQDDLLRNTILWNRDVLNYLILHRAIKRGDVGLMEDLLPHLFFRFSGSGNHKYANEVIELLQGLHREWPKEVAAYVREHCWLLNTKGGPDNFLPYDLAVEHTVKDVKTSRSKGPCVNWPLMKERSPAIPTLRALSLHMECEFRTISRGTSHTSPSHEKDVSLLAQHYIASKVYYNKKRHLPEDDRVDDYVADGFNDAATKVLPRWIERRDIYTRSTRQIFDSDTNTSHSEPEESLVHLGKDADGSGDGIIERDKDAAEGLATGDEREVDDADGRVEHRVEGFGDGGAGTSL